MKYLNRCWAVVMPIAAVVIGTIIVVVSVPLLVTVLITDKATGQVRPPPQTKPTVSYNGQTHHGPSNYLVHSFTVDETGEALLIFEHTKTNAFQVIPVKTP